MSHIGKRKIFLSSNVSVTKYKNFIIFSGLFGILKFKNFLPLKVIQKNKEFSFIPLIIYKKNKKFKSLWGTFNAHFKRLTFGLGNNYALRLKLLGVGFKIFKKKNKLIMKLGFSHKIFVEFPFTKLYMKKTKKRHLIFLLKSSDYDLLKTISVFLRSFKKPESYKGKGFSFRREFLNLKQGKKVKN